MQISGALRTSETIYFLDEILNTAFYPFSLVIFITFTYLIHRIAHGPFLPLFP